VADIVENQPVLFYDDGKYGVSKEKHSIFARTPTSLAATLVEAGFPFSSLTLTHI